MVFGLGVHLAKDGEERKSTFSFVGKLIVVGIQLFLLYHAGFFNVFK